MDKMNEGSYEVWTAFLKNRKDNRENSKISDVLIQRGLAQSYVSYPEKTGSEFQQDLIAMYGSDFVDYIKDLRQGARNLKLTKQDFEKVIKKATPEQKRRFLELIEKGKDKK